MIFGSTNDGTADGGGFRGVSPGATRRTPARGITPTSAVRRASSTSSRRARSSAPSLRGSACCSGPARRSTPRASSASPYIYNYVELADGTTPWSPQSVSTTSSLVLWMSEQGPFSATTALRSAGAMRWSGLGSTITSIRSRCANCRSPRIWANSANGGGFSRPSTALQLARCRSTITRRDGGLRRGCRARPGITSSYTAHPIFADDLVRFPARGRHRLPKHGRQRPGHAAVRRIVRPQPRLRARCSPPSSNSSPTSRRSTPTTQSRSPT